MQNPQNNSLSDAMQIGSFIIGGQQLQQKNQSMQIIGSFIGDDQTKAKSIQPMQNPQNNSLSDAMQIGSFIIGGQQLQQKNQSMQIIGSFIGDDQTKAKSIQPMQNPQNNSLSSAVQISGQQLQQKNQSMQIIGSLQHI